MEFTNYGFQLLFVQGLGFKLGFSRGLELRVCGLGFKSGVCFGSI